MKYILACAVVLAVLVPEFLYDVAKQKNVELSGTLYDVWAHNVVLERAVNDIVRALSNEQLAGQLLMPSFEKTDTLQSIEQKICTYQLGGVMILRNDVTPDMVSHIKNTATRCMPNTPFWVSIDSEPGLMQYRMPRAGVFADASELHTTEQSAHEAARIANVLHEYNIDITFAPVLDSAQNTAVIGTRSFGGTNDHRAQLGDAFIEATMNENIIPTAKHFPGHGAAVGDTHLTRQYVPGTLVELDAFKNVIAHGVPIIMAGHLIVRGGEWDSTNTPATLSHTILTDLLRTELGFGGVVITDSMSMGAVQSEPNAAVRAVQAGADIVLMPPRVAVAYEALVHELRTNSEFKNQVVQSVSRIVRLKIVQQWTRGEL